MYGGFTTNSYRIGATFRHVNNGSVYRYACHLVATGDSDFHFVGCAVSCGGGNRTSIRQRYRVTFHIYAESERIFGMSNFRNGACVKFVVVAEMFQRTYHAYSVANQKCIGALERVQIDYFFFHNNCGICAV